MKTFETLSECLDGLKKDGYVQDFNLHPEWIECAPLNLRLRANQFHVDYVYRFEANTNPDDSAVVYAISASSGIKGTLVDAYGVYSEAISPLMVKKLTIDRNTNPG
jgi:hypothetical protein